MRRTTLLVTTAVVLVTAGGAWALAAGPGDRAYGLERIFERFDADGDGQVTRAEVDAFRTERFEEMDGDGDGVVSLDEMREAAMAMAAERAEARFADLDADGDGTLVVDELAPEREVDIFARLDDNEDGVITEDELPFGPRRGFGRHGPPWSGDDAAAE